MNTFETANAQFTGLNFSQLISEAAYKLVLMVERMIQTR